jgi:hypothetical protein
LCSLSRREHADNDAGHHAGYGRKHADAAIYRDLERVLQRCPGTKELHEPRSKDEAADSTKKAEQHAFDKELSGNP